MATKLVGWEKVLDIYPVSNFLKGAKIPIFLMLPSVGCFMFKGNVTEVEILKALANLVSAGFPSILGFVLTGYALIVGFSGSDFLLNMAKARAGNKHTLFERVNATFAVVIGVLVVTYITSILIVYVIELHITWPFTKGLSIFNFFVLLSFLGLLYYSLCSLLDIVINIFNLGQFANVVAGKKLKLMEDIANEEKKEKGDVKENVIAKFLHCLLG